MNIVRAARPRGGFTVVANEVARDSRLSYRARGLLVYLLSLPDGWATDSRRLAAEGKEGRDAIRAALREIEDVGYLRRERRQGDRGRWAMVSVLRDAPESTGTDSPGPRNPAPGNPAAGRLGDKYLSTDTKDGEVKNLADGETVGAGALFDVDRPEPKPRRARPRDLLFDAVVEVCGIDAEQMPRTAASMVARCVRELRETAATPEQVRDRAEVYRERYRGASLTPTALVKHWPQLHEERIRPSEAWREVR